MYPNPDRETFATTAEAAREFAQNSAEHDADLCACGGSGWVLSPYDTWESCPAHSGVHPDDWPEE